MTRITVKYVNPPKPGRTFGTLRATDGNYYHVSAASLPRYQVGMTFDAPVQVSSYGTPPRTALWLADDFWPHATNPQPAQQPTQPPSPRTQRMASRPAHDSDRLIFATAIVGRSMGSGKFDSEDIDPLLAAALAAFDSHLGGEPPASR